MIYLDKYKQYRGSKVYFKTLDYLEGNSSYDSWNESLSLNESILTTDTFMSKFDDVLLAIYNKISSGLNEVSNKIINILKTFYSLAVKFFSKNKKILFIIALIVILIIVSAASSYAATTGNPPPAEFLNAALGYLDIKGPEISDMLKHSEHIKGNPESYINMAKAILTQMRDGGHTALSDDKEFMTASQGLANGALELVKSMKNSHDPGENKMYTMLVEVGSNLATTFSRKVVMIGK